MHRNAATCIGRNRKPKETYHHINDSEILKYNHKWKLWEYRDNTFPWISYLIGPSNSAPNAINFDTVLLMSGTVKDSIEE